jgi:hypothetical protein
MQDERNLVLCDACEAGQTDLVQNWERRGIRDRKGFSSIICGISIGGGQ